LLDLLQRQRLQLPDVGFFKCLSYTDANDLLLLYFCFTSKPPTS
jgi:hypothetical protein